MPAFLLCCAALCCADVQYWNSPTARAPRPPTVSERVGLGVALDVHSVLGHGPGVAEWQPGAQVVWMAAGTARAALLRSRAGCQLLGARLQPVTHCQHEARRTSSTPDAVWNGAGPRGAHARSARAAGCAHARTRARPPTPTPAHLTARARGAAPLLKARAGLDLKAERVLGASIVREAGPSYTPAPGETCRNRLSIAVGQAIRGRKCDRRRAGSPLAPAHLAHVLSAERAVVQAARWQSVMPAHICEHWCCAADCLAGSSGRDISMIGGVKAGLACAQAR